MDIIIIPAYNPDMKLIHLVEELYKKKLNHIVVVNDGSDQSALDIFHKLDEYAVVLTHGVNRGKGAAIKTALKYIFDNFDEEDNVVILDADGQHRPVDAVRILYELHNSSSDLVLGVRSFTGKVPFPSLIGNTITKYVFRLFNGKWISDTQTGLRAFSYKMIHQLLNVKGERFEYEMNVLLYCVRRDLKISEVPIATIYHDSKNSCSHFRVIWDSIRIYGNLLAFSGASFLSFLLDYLIFFPLVWMFGKMGAADGIALIWGNIAARFVSAAFNYFLNSTFVFRCKENRMKSIIHYAMLAGGILALNTCILYALNNLLNLNRAMAKLITEVLLFIISFTVQRFIIFRKTTVKRRKYFLAVIIITVMLLTGCSPARTMIGGCYRMIGSQVSIIL
ncbi:bifunctional glycosyltransferase family 2/GtrA family protein [Anaerocolumna xylanovorans]|uniref:Glycosyltransferase involved in cell wall bisynthesis n=1 Tax=Anaerocolumna xylanovorans DSM 12503 TaxID=1121345 RepID=A0A1M7YNA1_9FIRM|nr:bifunctional glycosyltransferase family 2/GtrA family protein [Anaerocolumna xylanovorans]SHO54016.1 Glycosyltransferase involved in cell wall bisynthesis [Anaerocolumna xylanovorans DSM 12503]